MPRGLKRWIIGWGIVTIFVGILYISESGLFDFITSEPPPEEDPLSEYTAPLNRMACQAGNYMMCTPTPTPDPNITPTSTPVPPTITPTPDLRGQPLGNNVWLPDGTLKPGFIRMPDGTIVTVTPTPKPAQ